ncbi:MAG: LamG-like jellyroll fold domain-containing protein [Acidobacteriota bacterium]
MFVRPPCRPVVPTCLLVSLACGMLTAPARATLLDEDLSFLLELPDDRPESFELALPLDDELAELRLERRSLRGPGFRVRVHDGTGLHEVEAPPVASYLGHLPDDPETLVVGYLGEGGFVGEVLRPDGPTLRIEPSGEGLHRLREEIFDEPIDGGGIEPPHSGRGVPEPASERRGGVGCELTRAQIAFDVDFPYYTDRGSSVPDSIANAEAHLLAVEAAFARDLLITYELVDIVVRTAPFYDPDENLLLSFRNEWVDNHADVERDVTHLLTGQPQGAAGLAYVGVVCEDSWHYAWSIDSSHTISHELGHNWGAHHCHDSARCTSMCSADCIHFGPNARNLIHRYRTGLGCLESVGGFAGGLGPYVIDDRVFLTVDQVRDRDMQVIDVLANDHDGNCEALTIEGFEPVSDRGGSVSLEVGAAADGRDALGYVPPCELLTGTDRFTITVRDESGAVTTSEVFIEVPDTGLRAYWPLDEMAGATTVTDLTGWERTGTVLGDPAWVPGVIGGALQLDGVDDEVVLPPLDLNGRFVSFTGWIRSDGIQVNGAGLIASREEDSHAALRFDEDNELRYHWNRDWATSGFATGLVVPDGTWTFVALVVEPDAATVWIDDGTGLRSARNELVHVAQLFQGAGRLGSDNLDDLRFRGALDDWRVHDQALTELELEELAALGGPAIATTPADGSVDQPADVVLQWTPGPGADSHDVYFGTDVEAVTNATPASPEFVGNFTTETSWEPPEWLLSERTYAWRVDARSGVGVRPGATWLFGIEDVDRTPQHYWRLDEAAGTTVSDATGMVSGDFRGDPEWTPGLFGSALELDGDDAVSLPGIPATKFERTISVWFRLNGPPGIRAGLVYTADAGTIAGMSFGRDDELVYRWGITSARETGLVAPEDTWCFAALVIEEERGTLYLHDGTEMRSHVNEFAHSFQRWAGETFLGMYSDRGEFFFTGAIDDVRIQERALTAAEIEAMVSAAGRALKPTPSAGARLPLAPSELSWLPGAGAETHDVYFGSDLASVRDADTSSPEYRGRQAEASWTLPTGLPDGTYYWRIDESAGADIVQGVTWHWAVRSGVGESLRVVRDVGRSVELSWRELGGDATYEVSRCVPAAGAPCTPLLLTTVGPGTARHVDAEDAGVLQLYRVRALGECQ